MEDLKFSENLLTEVMNDPKTQEIIKSSIQSSIAKAVEDSFRCYGDLHKAIENKIKTMLVPYIENYDLSAYIPKLDTILTEIVNTTTLTDNRTLLENFKELMTEPVEKTVSLETIFDKYCDYVAKHADSSDLNVSLDDGPHYECFDCYCSTDDTTPDWSSFERIDVEFGSDVRIDYGDEATIGISLSRYKNDKDESYSLCFMKEITINSLRDLSDFEIYLLKLTRAGVKVTGIDDFRTEVEPEGEPEPDSWS
jgi:hypothetical protein